MNPAVSASVFQSEYLSALLSSIDESVVATDENFIIQYWNKGAEQIFGYSSKETIGKRGATIMKFHYPAETEAEARETLIKKGTWKGKLTFTTKARRTRLLDVSVTVVKNNAGRVIGYVGVHRDITEYNQAKESLATFISIISSIDDDFFIVDKNLKLALIDEKSDAQLKKFFGIECVVGDDIIPKLPSARKRPVMEHFTKALNGERTNCEVAIENALGRVQWLQVNFFPIKDKHGFINHACCLLRDITVQKASLNQLQQSEFELKAALAKEHMLNDMKSRFVSMASHEFRTPLSTILSSTFLIEKYITTEQQTNRQKHITRIRESISHMNSLLEDFLSLGKLEEGKTLIHKSSFNLTELVKATLEDLESLKKPGQVVAYKHSGSRNIVSDKKLLRNIIINLLNNAFKFSAENKAIFIKTSVDKRKTIISIEDEGIGISNEDKKHLFESFYRGKNAQNIQGTGLGLHIVRRYTQLLNGDINLVSNLGNGTRVTVTLKNS